MVHHKAYTLLVSVLVECLDIEIGICGHKVEHVVLLATEPILPADIPALDQHLVEAVLGCKVDIATYVLVVSTVVWTWSNLCVVALAELYAIETLGVVPAALAEHQLPPNTDILHRLNPRCILQSARVIQIQDEVRRKHLASAVGHLNCTPRRVARCLQPTLIAECVGRKV